MNIMAAPLNYLHGINGKGFPQPFNGGSNYRTWKRRMVAVMKGEGIAERVKVGDKCAHLDDVEAVVE